VPGSKVRVEVLHVPGGNRVILDRVLFIADEKNIMLGRPVVDGAKVIATCVSEDLGRKTTAFKYHRKNRYRRKIGHRQPYTELNIERILKPGEAVPEAPAPVKAEPKRKAPEAVAEAAPVKEAKAEKPKAKAPAKKAAPKAKAVEEPKAKKAEKKEVKPKAAPKKVKAEAETPKPKTTRKKTSPKAEEK
jgi:large subunit ribosomal protein L21